MKPTLLARLLPTLLLGGVALAGAVARTEARQPSGRHSTQVAILDGLLGLPHLLSARSAQGPTHRDAELAWEDVVVPAGFALDLGTGRVTGTTEPDRPTLRYQGELLFASVPLRVLPPVSSPPRARIDRDEGEVLPSARAIAGGELTFDLFTEGWGYVRVLEVTPHRVSLEYVRDPDPRRRRLEREPAELEAVSDPRGVSLHWPARSGASYRIDRRLLPRRPFDPPGAWREVARVETSRWSDDEPPAGRIAEYRVSREDPEGGVGWRARGVVGFAPEGRDLVAPANARVDLLTGAVDGERVDLTVEYVRESDVRLQPGEGVQACLLSEDAESLWDTPDELCYAPLDQSVHATCGRVLALRLPEGALIRLRIEAIRGREVTFGRQVNLDGSPIFPPAPASPEIRWEPGCGVVFTFEEPPAVPGGRRPSLVVEREGTLDAEDWEVCLEGSPDELELTDPVAADEVLLRYRFRQRLGERQLSPASAAVSVLLGDDGGVGSEALLERAVADLGHRDFDRRERARAVILAMGERAWPKLGEALRSPDPEVADAARELILSIPGADEGEGLPSGGGAGLAQLLLGVHAAETGVGAPPTADWVAPEAGARASAALRGAGAREVPAMAIEAWRRVLAEADPDQGVRLAALLADQLEREGLGGDPPLEVLDPLSWRELLVDDGWSPDWLAPGVNGGPERPWLELAIAQVRRDLAGRSREASEVRAAANERALLALLSLAAFDRTGDPLFLDVASRAVEDPVARLRGALDLARERREWDRLGHEGRPAETLRLERADTELLREVLKRLDPDGPGVDLVLPGGVYELLPGGAPLVISAGRVRLRGEQGCELRCGLSVSTDAIVVLENLTLAPGAGSALAVMRAEVRVVDCTVRGASLGIFGSDSVVELERSAVLATEEAPPGTQGIRLQGRSMLLARESRIEAPGSAVSGVRAVLLERCAVLSRQQNAVEGGATTDLWVIGCLLGGGGLALSNGGRGLLDGVVLVEGRARRAPLDAPLSICAEHLHHTGAASDFASGVWLGRCALRD